MKGSFNACILIIALSFFTYTNSQNHGIESTGDFLQLALPITALTSNLVFKEDTNYLWQDLKAFSASIVLTHTFKTLIDKERPNGATDGHAFPSGHTSCAFAGAAIIHKRFGWKIGVPAYLLASYVGWSRINANRHDLWDVLGGSIVGIGSIFLFSKDKNKIQLKFSRIYNYNTIGIAMRF